MERAGERGGGDFHHSQHPQASSLSLAGAHSQCGSGGRLCPEPSEVGIWGQGGGGRRFGGSCLDL